MHFYVWASKRTDIVAFFVDALQIGIFKMKMTMQKPYGAI